MPLETDGTGVPGDPFNNDDTTDAPGGAVVYGDDDDILAGLDKIDDEMAAEKRKKTDAPAKKKAKDDDEDEGKNKPKPKAKPKDDADDDDQDEDDDEDEGDDRDDDEDTVEDEDDDDAEDDDREDDNDEPDAGDEAPDRADDTDEEPLPSKELARLHREKKRQDEDYRRRDGELRQRQTAFETERTGFEKDRDALLRSKQEIEALSARVKTSPQAAIALLRKLGMTKETFKVAQGDWDRWWSEDTGAVTEVDGVKRELDELKAWKAKTEKDAADRAAAEREQRAIASFIDETARAVKKEKHPLLRANLKNDSKSAKARLFATADELARRTGRPPSHSEVVNETERRLREDAKRLGLAVPKTKNDPHADEPRPAKKKASQQPPGRDKRAEADDEDDNAKLLRELNEMDAKKKAKKTARR